MKRSVILRSFVMVALVVATACAHDTSDPETPLIQDPRFLALVGEMHLPDYAVQRLEMFVGTLDASRTMAWHANATVQPVILDALDVEVGRALPSFVPAEFVQRLRTVLRDAMRAP